MSILITGSLAFDRIAVFRDRFANHIIAEKIHQLSVSFDVDDMSLHYGGTAGNIAYNLSLLQTKPRILATVGTDFDPYSEYLAGLNIDISFVKVIDKTLTASAMIMTDLDDNQITAFSRGAMKYASKLDLQEAASGVDFCIVSSDSVKAMSLHASKAREISVPYLADPGQSIPSFSGEALQDFISGSFLLIVNDYEWELVQEKTGWNQADILQKTKAVIVTYGEKGSKLLEKKGVSTVDVVKAGKVVDPTGAGDAYRAGLVYGLSKDFDLKKSARIGAFLAAKAVEKKGTQNHHINKNKFDQFLKSL